MIRIRFEVGDQNRVMYENPAVYYSIGYNQTLYENSQIIDLKNAKQRDHLIQRFGKSLGSIMSDFACAPSTFDWDGREPIIAWFMVDADNQDFQDYNLSWGPYDQIKTVRETQEMRACIGHVYNAEDILINVAEDAQDQDFCQASEELHIGSKTSEFESISGGFGNYCSWLHVTGSSDQVVSIWGSGEIA